MLGGTHPDETWAALIEALPSDEQALRRVLPYRLGVTWRPDGGWGDYVHFEVIYDLVGYMADLTDGVDEDKLALYRRAHHIAGYHLLLTDRVADNQVAEDAALTRDREWLTGLFYESMSDACGDSDLVRRTVDAAIQQWRDAVDAEQAAFARGSMEPEEYATIAYGKVATLWVAAELMLREHAVDNATVVEAKRWFETLLLALQCNDDAVDEEEDIRCRRPSFPGLLTVPRDAFFAAGRFLSLRASCSALTSRTSHRIRSALPQDDTKARESLDLQVAFGGALLLSGFRMANTLS